MYESVSGARLNVKKTVGLVTDPNLIDGTSVMQMANGPEKVLGVPVRNIGKQNEFWVALVKKTSVQTWGLEVERIDMCGEVLHHKEYWNISNSICHGNENYPWTFHF